MLKKSLFIFALWCLTFSIPLNSLGTPCTYEASGSLKNIGDDRQFEISDSVVIDDSLRLWNGSTETPAPLASTALGNNQYSYFISSYSFEISEIATSDQYSFSGDSGCFYIERFDSGIGDLMWFLDDGSGNWHTWTGENFHWFHSDMSSCNLFDETNKLAPIIQLTALDYFFDDPIFSVSVNTELWLSKTNPIPEPSTVLLFSFGLLAFLPRGRRHKKINHRALRKT